MLIAACGLWLGEGLPLSSLRGSKYSVLQGCQVLQGMLAGARGS